jgi:hypothetical protein
MTNPIRQLAIVAVLLLLVAADVAVAQPAAPTLNPITATAGNPRAISGSTTQSGTLRIYVNNDLLRSVSVGAGAFSTGAPLMDGSNDVRVTLFAAGQESASSATRSTSLALAPCTIGGTITTDRVLTRGSTGACQVSANTVVGGSARLWIQPGVELFGGSLQIDSSVWSRGKANNTIVFHTPVTIAGAGSALSPNLVEYTLVESGGSGLTFKDSAAGQVRYSTFQSSNYGILVNCACSGLQIGPGNWFRKNTNGIKLTSDVGGGQLGQFGPNPTITGNGFFQNAQGALVAGQYHSLYSSVTVNATDNWWGSSDPAYIDAVIQDRVGIDPQYQPYYATVNWSGYKTANVARPHFINGGHISQYSAGPREYGAGNYVFQGDQSFNDSVAMDDVLLEAGVNISAMANARWRVRGRVVAQGTSTLPVVISGATHTQGFWRGFLTEAISGNRGTVDLTHADIRDAVAGVDYTNGLGTVTNSKFINNSTGIVVRAYSSPNLSNGNEFSANVRGVEVLGNGVAAANPLPVLNNNMFFNNSAYNLYVATFGSASSVTLQARDSWWGSGALSAIEPTIYHRPDSPSTSPLVDYTGFRGSIGGPPAVSISEVVASPWQVLPGSQNANISFRVNGATTVTATVVTPGDCGIADTCGQPYPACTPVRTITQSFPSAGTYSIQWDGRDNQVPAQLVTGSGFRVELSGTDGASSFTYPTEANSTFVPLGVNLNQIFYFATPGDNGVGFNAFENAPLKIDIPRPGSLGAATPVAVRAYKDTPAPFTWLLADVTTLPRLYMFSGWFSAGGFFSTGHIHECNHFYAPNLVGVSQLTGVVSPLFVVKPNGPYLEASYEQVSAIEVGVLQAGTATVKILPPGTNDFDSASAHVVFDGPVSAGSYRFEYEHLVAADPNMARYSTAGTYSFVVRVRNAAGATSIYRGSLNVYR